MSISHIVRNSLITLFSASGASSLYRSHMKKKHGALVRIVVFHDVLDEIWFESLIQTLSKSYHILTPADFFAKRFVVDAINVLITFDDGYDSWMTKARPVLLKYGVQGLFFINSGLLDVAHEREKFTAFMRDELIIRTREPLTWDGARALTRAGHTIGSHAYHHVNLATLSREEVRSMLTKDKGRIEEVLGVTVTECAYPFGTEQHVNEIVKDEAQTVGFARGYTAISRFAPSNETFAVPRMCIEDETTPQSLRRWVEGGYDLFVMLKKLCAR